MESFDFQMTNGNVYFSSTLCEWLYVPLVVKTILCLEGTFNYQV